MALFRFNLNECGVRYDDEEGIDVADLGAARTVAIRSARDVMCGEIADGHLCLGCSIEIVAPDGQIVDVVPFRDAVTVTDPECGEGPGSDILG